MYTFCIMVFKTTGHIERTFTAEEPVEDSKDMFSMQGTGELSNKAKIGIDENNPIYKLSKWCYDTPGVVHPEQVMFYEFNYFTSINVYFVKFNELLI